VNILGDYYKVDGTSVFINLCTKKKYFKNILVNGSDPY
jgi:hypothetical protein